MCSFGKCQRLGVVSWLLLLHFYLVPDCCCCCRIVRPLESIKDLYWSKLYFMKVFCGRADEIAQEKLFLRLTQDILKHQSLYLIQEHHIEKMVCKLQAIKYNYCFILGNCEVVYLMGHGTDHVSKRQCKQKFCNSILQFILIVHCRCRKREKQIMILPGCK